MVDPLAVATEGFQSRSEPDNPNLCIATRGWICLAAVGVPGPGPTPPPTPGPQVVGGGSPLFFPPAGTEEVPAYLLAKKIAVSLGVVISGSKTEDKLAGSIGLSVDSEEDDDKG